MLHKLIAGLSLLCATSTVLAQNEDDKDAPEPTKRPSWSAGLPERTKAADLSKPEFKSEIDNDIELDMSEFGLQEKPQIEIDLPINDTIAVKAENSENQDAERLAAEQLEAERLAAEQLEAERLAAEQLEAERLAAERLAAEQLEAERLAAEQLEAERLAAEQLEAERLAAEQLEAERLAAEQLEAERLAAEQLEAERLAAESTINIPIEQSLASVEPPASAEVIDTAGAAAEQANYQWGILKREPVQYPVKAAMDNLEGWVDVEVTIDPSGKVVSASPVKYSRRGRLFGKPAVQSVNKWLFNPPSEYGITENITRIYKVEFSL